MQVGRIPSHDPLQLDPSPRHCARLPTGCPVTAWHCPSSPFTLQAKHCAVHALLQQYPSTQKLDAHWFDAVHEDPLNSFAVHCPWSQKFPTTQSPSPVHDVLHPLVPHRYGAHATVTTGGQLPIPLHTDATCPIPPAQLAGRHVVDAPGNVQAVPFCPSQLPPHEVPSLTHAARPPAGGPTTATHLPSCPRTLHAEHCPVHRLSQHTPSMHKLDVHCTFVEHASPLSSFPTQLPLAQNPPWMHWLLFVHDVRHAVAPHRNGAHVVVNTAGQLPSPSHVAAAVSTPFAQLADRHATCVFG